MGRKRLPSQVRRKQQCQRKKISRNNDEGKGRERGANKERERLRRQDSAERVDERARNKNCQKKRRRDPVADSQETERNTIAKRKLRSSDQYREDERLRNKTSKQMNAMKAATWDDLKREYQSQVKDGPTHVCASCGGLWFSKCLRTITTEYFTKRGCSEEFTDTLLQKANTNGAYQLCGTCLNAAVKQELPKRNMANGFSFPDLQPELTSLTQLEERLVSPRLPFMQIRSVGVYQQHGLRGNVVNVENDSDTCAKVIPRQFDDTATVQVMLMRRMKYKVPYLFETVRPMAIFEAAQLLCQSELYKEANIILSNEWLSKHPEPREKFIARPQDHAPAPRDSSDHEHEAEKSDDDAEDNVNPGADESLFLENDNRVVKIAPGEGKKPIPWLKDIHAEQLSFPTIYGGVPRKFKKGLKITHVDIARSEARSFDRRAARPDKILYTAKLLQNQQVADQLQTWLRKRKGGRTLTAGDLKREEFVDSLVSHDDGYRCLRKIRLSPAYWQGQEKKVLAMARQLFIPTIFLTLSAAETKWPELLVILEQIHHNRTITHDEAMNMTFQEKAALIRADPCVCAMYFDHRFRSMLNLLLNKKNGAFSPYELQDYYNKIEFAHRGSAHNHGLYWMKDAPVYDRDDESTIQKCTDYIDSLITCRRNGDEELEKVIGFQIHKHTHTCKRRTRDGGFRCRFGLPLPVMRKTSILQPLTPDDPAFDSARANFEKVQAQLNSLTRHSEEDVPFGDYLAQLNLTEAEYILAIRTSIKRDKIFLKRRTCDIYINAYNEKILKAWKANMDIQFILDPYSCVKYCVSYLTKSCTGVSKLMRDVDKDIKCGNYTLRERLRKFANTFLTGVEIAAQEAAYLVLGLPLTNCSREDTFVSTGPPDERVGLLKSKKDLEQLDDGSADIYVTGLVEHYCQRPEVLTDVCLAEFASMYTFVKNTLSKAALPLLNGSGFIVRRTKPRIVRYRRYNQQQDPLNYAREQLMLYVPWRNEEKELTAINVSVAFETQQDTIKKNRQLVDPNHGKSKVEDLVEEVERDISGLENVGDNDWLDPDFDTDIAESTGQSRQEKKVDFLMPPKQIPNNEYLQLIRGLNERQRRYFFHVVHMLNTGKVPFYEYLGGGAGVGKTTLITAIVQYVLRRFAGKAGVSLDSLPVLVFAPTGKAAFNAGGVTAHCALRLPPTQYCGNMAPLSEDVCNSLRVKFKNLELVIIDEISMLSLEMFCQIDSRLRQIFQTNTPFGGRNVLVIGDFFQIRPVMAQFVFEEPKNHPYGSIIGNELWSMFKMFELTQIMRQNKALAFAQALNNMARGEMTDDDIQLLKSREVSNGLSPPPEAIHLFKTNDECAEHNNSVHEALNTESAVSVAVDKVDGAISDHQKEAFLAFLQTRKPPDTDGLPNSVRLQIGAEYMVSSNVNVPDGIFNGSNGRLEHIQYGTNPDGSRIPITAYVRFNSLTVGAEARSGHHYPAGVDHTLTPIKLLTKQLNKVGYHQGLTVTRRQFPLLPANGITIVKSQGSTYHQVVVHIHKRMPRDLLYVACSRACTLEGLCIVGDFKPPSHPAQYILNEIRRLKSNPAELSVKFLEDCPDSCTRLMYHNVQSLHAHYPDIVTNISYMAANYLCFLQPWTFKNEEYRFPDFVDIRREDCQEKRSSYGSFIASKTAIENYKFNHMTAGPKSHYSFTTWEVEDVICCLVYCSPNASTAPFLRDMEQKVKDFAGNFAVIFGDFNMDVRVNTSVVKMFRDHGYQFILPTTEYSTYGGTQIDLAFSNFQEVEAWYCESVFSYHKPISITWPNEIDLTLVRFEVPEEQMDTEVGNADDDEDMDVEESPHEVESEQTLAALQSPPLPLLTKENAREVQWRIGAQNLYLIDIKTLPDSLQQSELAVMADLDQGSNNEYREVFTPRYLTDSIIDMCMKIRLSGTSSTSINAAEMELVLHGCEFAAEEGEWDEVDNVFMPINQHGNHWVLVVVQPKQHRVLYLDPNSHRSQSRIATPLLHSIQRVLPESRLDVVTPCKANQQDAWNCGVFLLQYVDQIMQELPLTDTFDPILYRQELLQRLFTHSDQFLQNLH